MGNLLWPGRRALVLQNGWFSGRFAEMAAGVGAEVEVLSVPEGQAICAERVAERLKNQRYDVVTMVQGENLQRRLHDRAAGDCSLVPRARGAGGRRRGLHVAAPCHWKRTLGALTWFSRAVRRACRRCRAWR